MKAFAQFASDLDAATRAQLERGYRLEELLKQGQYVPLPVTKQIMAIYAGISGYLDKVPVESIGRWEKELYAFIDAKHSDVLRLIAERGGLDNEVEQAIKGALDAFATAFAA
jgi:F-type H+-transporting ATPase subunit alpha